MALTCWHYEIDTLPHFSGPSADRAHSARPQMSLRIPVGVWTGLEEKALDRPVVNVVVEVKLDDQPPFQIRLDRRNPHGFVRWISRDVIEDEGRAERRRERTGREHGPGVRESRWYLDMAPGIARGNQYFEAIVGDIPERGRVRYTIDISPLPINPLRHEPARTLGPYTIHAVVPPAFRREDVFFASDGGDKRGPACVLLYRSDAHYHYIRADFADISGSRPDFDLDAGAGRISLAAPAFDAAALASLPHIDPFTDSVVAVIPKKQPLTSVYWHGRLVRLDDRSSVGRARLMFIHYCMQGLNDLFELPNALYDPPRTFIQTTMHDEKATYSSRPDTAERSVGDGYLFTLEAHRRYGIKHMWTFNGGVLALMAHDCPDELADVKDDIAAGRLEPTIAGFGGHRLPYYQEETNRYAIELGITMMRKVLGQVNDVYYLDQRVYKQLPNVWRALEANRIRYVVVDEQTGFGDNCGSMKRGEHASGNVHLDGQYLWQDEKSKLYILVINDELKEKMLDSSEAEWRRGKLALPLRQKLLYFAANPVIREKNLLVYSDDADKASGNGWFDGTYSGDEKRYPEMYAAALEWIAAHPWIEVVTSSDLRPEDCVGTIDMVTAIDPVLDRGGMTSIDRYNQRFHFDAWYDNWKRFPACWIGTTFEEMSQAAEYAVIDWPSEYQNDFYELAKMCFAMGLHESQWNKQPLEEFDNLYPNDRLDVVEPEDFVISATLQIRNTHVYLAASAWAAWATKQPKSNRKTYVNQGPLVEMLEAVTYAKAPGREKLGGKIFPSGLYLDKDLLENVVLYNRQVLAVIDRNGGRVTHLFAMPDPENGGPRRPVCVSGTPKAWQFLTADPTTDESFVCDGEVLQNTVYTPNHAFIACDVKQAVGTLGSKYNPKTGIRPAEQVRWYPDNFNEYQVAIESGKGAVQLRYERTSPGRSMDLTSFRDHLERDRAERASGKPGIVFHPFPSFSKRIALEGRRLTIEYFDTEAGHVVANELCGDVYRALLHGETNRRTCSERSIVVHNHQGGRATVTLPDAGCVFTPETLEGEGNRRLHRVMTDCIEVMASSGGNFSYQLDV